MSQPAPETIRETVAASYGARVRSLLDPETIPLVMAGDACCSDDSSSASSCCGEDAAESSSRIEQITAMYADSTITDLPETVTSVAFGCGNPTAIAAMQPGETVLDLGSGGGIDCFLAAKMVGETGRVIGVDMTPEMIALARRNKEKVGAANVEFRLGEIETLPVEAGTVDVIISNCVINLSPDKDAVLREAFRVLRPGGRFQVSDMVWLAPPPEDRTTIEAWSGCVAGALLETDFIAKLGAAGFKDVTSVATPGGPDGLASANITARKP